MFSDTGVFGMYHLATKNPLRWSTRKSVGETIAELESYRDCADRPIKMKIYDAGVEQKQHSTNMGMAIVELRRATGTWHMTSLYHQASRGPQTNDSSRPVCKHGSQCFRSSASHLMQEAHPADQDYLSCCRECGVEPEIVSLRRLFEWCDRSGHGRIGRDELSEGWPEVQRLSSLLGPLDDELWNVIDSDGNGQINFAEFVDFATVHSVDLPLGLDHLLGAAVTAETCCGVAKCHCEGFAPRRKRCKFGEACYQKGDDHRVRFCHPGCIDWAANAMGFDAQMCRCGHKRALHASAARGSTAVNYPSSWVSLPPEDGEDFNCLVDVDEAKIRLFQTLLDSTYSDVTTRDRANHGGGSWEVPRGFEMVSALRNENSRMWRKYTIRKAELLEERRLIEANPQLAAELPPYRIYDDVRTTKAWESFEDVDDLNNQVNEWYLFHGTSAEASRLICENDFKFRLAGSATGTLYGKGSYLAESITKADEYSSAEDGCFTVLLCRALGGRVRYCDERAPNADRITANCVHGPYDCVLGDRLKISRTYREFVFFDTENLYPEYILKYKRKEMFKSPSHPRCP